VEDEDDTTVTMISIGFRVQMSQQAISEQLVKMRELSVKADMSKYERLRRSITAIRTELDDLERAVNSNEKTRQTLFNWSK
jgi:hypothetical protein